MELWRAIKEEPSGLLFYFACLMFALSPAFFLAIYHVTH